MSIDLDAYFKRIGYTGACTPTLNTLNAIHRLHPSAIAFENLNPLLKKPVPLDLPSLEQKLVDGGRGGYCFEHNTLLRGVLEAIGFEVKALSARVRWSLPAGTYTPRVHMVLLVIVNGERYFADVGFGGNTLSGPVLFAPGLEQETPHEPVRLTAEDGCYVIEVKIKGGWAALYAFDLAEQFAADIEMSNWFTAAYPSSRFMRELIVGKTEPNGRFALLNNQLAFHGRDGKTERRRLKSIAELRAVLTDVFRLRVPEDGELDTVLARFAEASPRAAE
jgi:N-hydroxyarylamine O-acetyltransferase